MKILLFVLFTMFASACGPAQSETASAPVPAFKTSASVKQLMLTIVIPSSDIVFDVGSKPPEDEAGWARVENAALVLAESGNLLMIGDRAKTEPQWMEFSRAMIDATQSALAPPLSISPSPRAKLVLCDHRRMVINSEKPSSVKNRKNC